MITGTSNVTVHSNVLTLCVPWHHKMVTRSIIICKSDLFFSIIADASHQISNPLHWGFRFWSPELLVCKVDCWTFFFKLDMFCFSILEQFLWRSQNLCHLTAYFILHRYITVYGIIWDVWLGEPPVCDSATHSIIGGYFICRWTSCTCVFRGPDWFNVPEVVGKEVWGQGGLSNLWLCYVQVSHKLQMWKYIVFANMCWLYY